MQGRCNVREEYCTLARLDTSLHKILLPNFDTQIATDNPIYQQNMGVTVCHAAVLHSTQRIAEAPISICNLPNNSTHRGVCVRWKNVYRLVSRYSAYLLLILEPQDLVACPNLATAGFCKTAAHGASG